MQTDRRLQLAELLCAARRDGKQIQDLPPHLVPETEQEAYQVNGMVAELLGWDALGWKIAATTPAMQEKLRRTRPIYGRTYRRHATTSPARFRHGTLLDPLVECEFFVTLGQDLPARDTPWRMEEILGAVRTVHAGIEVAECRFPMEALPPLPAVLADGSASGRYVFGGLIEGWREGLEEIPVVLEVDGVRRRQGRGADVMGNPLSPVLWLAEARRREGDGLRAGETISTGSATGMFPVQAGQHVRAIFGDLAEVQAAFETGAP
ncbi:2-keto-4-pentenoate hydratase [Roseomonas sp. KE0001]|uniref:2-keto-4-pentenoate hydratase n=1 Tax=Roseomonas sp. KE0001 TaxID=2479201 RepID=UPI0018E03F48|nr:fumarylacetoacetate hydrolase family protein [Roseomonas sp. KE0001]MBI0433667.1 hydratase [Roseomonas sp. KE0001]